jgi:aminotransferase
LQGTPAVPQLVLRRSDGAVGAGVGNFPQKLRQEAGRHENMQYAENQTMGSYQQYISRSVQATPYSGIRRFFDLIAQTEGIISLGIGEPDYTTPGILKDACKEALDRGYTKYTSNSGILDLRNEIASYLATRFDLHYADSSILITVGVSEGIDLALRAILNPGDEILIGEPCYVSYAPCVSFAGGRAVMVATRAEDEFRLRKKNLIAGITEKTKAILLSYPNNPTGAIMTREDLEEVAWVAQAYNLLVISDEAYAELTYGIGHTSIANLPGMQERTILLNGFSKMFAMTGWRLGFAAGHEELIDAMLKIHQYTMLCAPSISQYAVLKGLLGGCGFIQEMVNDYNQRRRILVDGLREIGLPCFEPKGAFYAFPSIRHTGMSSDEFSERLLFESKVAVVPGNAFGASGEGYVRCCYATAREKIVEAIERIDNFVRRYQLPRASTL